MKLNRFIWFYIIYLVLSATFARQLLIYLTGILGSRCVRWIPWMFLGGILFSVVFITVKYKMSHTRLFEVLLTFFIITIFLKTMENPDERIHIFQYGLLGFLIVFENRELPLRRAFSFALIVVLLTTSADELFQAFLPNRVGDLRDVAFGCIGGMWGAFLAAILSGKFDQRCDRNS